MRPLLVTNGPQSQYIKEIGRTFHRVPFHPAQWRKGENLPQVQGLVLGSQGKKGKIAALVDSDDIHCLMIGAAGVGKTEHPDDLAARAKAVYIYLKDHANKEGACWPGINTIAAGLGLSRSTVKRALGDLVKAGLVEKSSRWRGNGSLTSNLYRVK